MASSSLCVSPIAHLIGSGHRVPLFRFSQKDSSRRTGGIRFHARKESSSAAGETGKESENAVLRAAWYGSEILGIVASFFRSTPPPSPSASPEIEIETEEGLGSVAGRARVVEAIKQDFDRSYFVTGNLTLKAYEEDCEFADPAGSFRGLSRFKRNCTNFGSLLVKSNMKLTKWEDFEDKGIGHWRFSCVMSFPWRPILSATGYTEYYFDAQSGKVCRHVEHWNVPKMALLKQIFRPTRWVWGCSFFSYIKKTRRIIEHYITMSDFRANVQTEDITLSEENSSVLYVIFGVNILKVSKRGFQEQENNGKCVKCLAMRLFISVRKDLNDLSYEG